MKVGYARVSTGEQSQDGSLEQQINRLEKAGCSHIYLDIKSGRRSDRAEFNKMLTVCKRGDISEIIVTRLDRLARTVITIVKTIELIKEYGVKLTILDAPVEDMNNPFTIFSLQQMGALAELESNLIQQRVKHGFDYFRQQNKAPSHVPFGYIRQNGKYEPDMSTINGITKWEIANRIIDYVLNNKANIRATIRWLFSEYGVRFSTTGMHTWLKNPTLCGHTRYNAKFNTGKPELWDIRHNTHVPLISDEIYNSIQNLLAENKRIWGSNQRRSNSISPISGLIYCGDCGGKCYARSTNQRLYCKKREMHGRDFCSNRSCVLVSDVCDRINQELSTRAQQINDALNGIVTHTEESPKLSELKNTLASLQKLPKNSVIDDAINNIMIQISQLKEPVDNHQQAKYLVDTFSDIEFFNILSDTHKAELYRYFVRNVVILNGVILRVELTI